MLEVSEIWTPPSQHETHLPREDDMTDPAAWNNRGNALLGLGRFDEAKDSFQQALDISGRKNVQHVHNTCFRQQNNQWSTLL